MDEREAFWQQRNRNIARSHDWFYWPRFSVYIVFLVITAIVGAKMRIATRLRNRRAWRTFTEARRAQICPA
jgi:hypothetical protein